jgi:hypothetical protein
LSVLFQQNTEYNLSTNFIGTSKYTFLKICAMVLNWMCMDRQTEGGRSGKVLWHSLKCFAANASKTI